MTTHEILLAAQAAKLPLALADTDTKNAALEAMAVALVENSDAILAANKQDLAGQGEAFTAAQQQLAPYFKAIIPLTARDAASLQPLCQAVAQLLGTANLDPNAAALCSARQLSAAKEARDALAEALSSQEDGFGLDAAGVCISDAQRALARLTGEDATEATIDEVFSTFCVGK